MSIDPQDRFASIARDGYVSLNGLRFHYLEWDSLANRTLLALHGLCADAHIFDRLAPGLTDRYRVIALDMRGHGETEWAEDYTWRRWIEDIDALRLALGLARMSILGHSAGGWFAYLYAALQPGVVERLVVGEAAPRDEAQAAHTASAGDAFYAATSFASLDEAIRQARATGTRATDEELRERLRWNLRPTPDGRLAWRYDLRVIAARDRDELRPPPELEWELAARIDCPVLVLRGALSDFSNSDAARARVRRLVELLPSASSADIEGAGHGLWMDQPAATLEAIRAFLWQRSKPL